jgi:hypothetical protein
VANFDLPGLKVYPNPAFSVVNLEVFVKSTENISVHIRDIAGREVYSGGMEKTTGLLKKEIQINHLIPGVYLLEVRYSGGIKWMKVVKE